MFTESIKKCIISLAVTSSLILTCGCQSTENNPQISDKGTSSPQENMTDNKDVVTTAADNGEIVTTVTESEPVTTPAETTEMDCELIPDEWIVIYDSLYAVTHFNTIINADCSSGEMNDVIQSLVFKNILYSLTKWGMTFEIDWDNPITYGDDGLTLYPVISVFFPDVRSIYELASSVYGNPNDKVYTYDPSANSFYSYDRLFFTEIDGKMYVDPNCIVNKGASEPFCVFSNIEITEQTEDMCKLTWHYPLNYEYEEHYTARYIDGAWRLDSVIGY